jgi:hypothetical protein
MSSDTSAQAAADAVRLEFLAAKIRVVPMKLAAAKVEIHPFCQGDVKALPDDAKQTLVTACELLQSAIADISTVLEFISEWAEGKRDYLPQNQEAAD